MTRWVGWVLILCPTHPAATFAQPRSCHSLPLYVSQTVWATHCRILRSASLEVDGHHRLLEYLTRNLLRKPWLCARTARPLGIWWISLSQRAPETVAKASQQTLRSRRAELRALHTAVPDGKQAALQRVCGVQSSAHTPQMWKGVVFIPLWHWGRGREPCSFVLVLG